jgi:hypothetical protein
MAAKRGLALALSMASVSQADADDWKAYTLPQLGFTFEAPSGFVLTPNNGSTNRLTFDGPNGAYLAVGGGSPAEQGFVSSVEEQMRQDEQDGWHLTYRRITPRWASYSGIRDGQIRYARAILVCGARVTVFVVDYDQDEKVAYDPVVTRMVRSMKERGC